MKRTKNDRIDRNRELTTEELKHVSGGGDPWIGSGGGGGGNPPPPLTGARPLEQIEYTTSGGPSSGGSGTGPTA